MTQMSDFAISVDRATQEELDAVQSIVKANANGWWHRHAAFWVVGGKTASEWRDLIKPALVSGSSVLVLQLPENDAEKNWSFNGPEAKAKCEWFHKNY
jgi:hypothetical protein